MICSKRLLSAVLSCVLATAVFPTASMVTANAGQISEDSVSDIYDSTNNAESKASISTADAISADDQDMASEEPFNVFDIYNAHQEFVTVKETPPPPPSLYVKKEGIDVSYAQGKIDWKAVKESGVDYAIIRAGYGYAKKYPNQIDTTFKYNIENAQAVGMEWAFTGTATLLLPIRMLLRNVRTIRSTKSLLPMTREQGTEQRRPHRMRLSPAMRLSRTISSSTRYILI